MMAQTQMAAAPAVPAYQPVSTAILLLPLKYMLQMFQKLRMMTPWNMLSSRHGKPIFTCVELEKGSVNETFALETCPYSKKNSGT